MISITSQATQAKNNPASSVFPQPIPDSLLGMSLSDAVSAILHLFDSGAIAAETAEGWLIFIENLHSVSA